MAVNKHIIDVQTKGAKKSEKQIKGVSSALGGLAKQAGIAAAAYFGTRALINGIKGSIDAYAAQELAEKKLQAALGKTSPALLAQARALQQVSMFGDEVVMEAQAMIAAFVKDEEAVAAATKATLDLAAAKGFDLVTAADLVSKTLGSSTNALTRYGIEVKGAVGSTERLTSLTENIAEVFGGQATQQAQTLTGQLAQMNNAMGDTAEDLGELLAPALSGVAGFLKTAAENVGDFIRGFTDTPLDTTIKQLEDLGVAGEGLLRLKNLQIDRDLKVVNVELSEMAKGYTSIEQLSEKSNSLTTEAANLARELSDINKNLSKEDEKRIRQELRSSQQTIHARGTSLAFMQMKAEKEKELENQLGITQRKRIDGIEEELGLLPDIGALLFERNQLEAKRVEIAENLKGVEGDKISTQEAFNVAKQIEYDTLIKANEASETENNLLQTWIKGNEAKAKSLGIVSDAEKNAIKNKKATSALMTALAKEDKGIAVAEAIHATYSSARIQFKEFSKAYPAPLGQILGSIAAAASVASGLKDVERIKAAQYGADFITDGPQMMLVGEGSGPEHVQVTPLAGGDPNINGPQGGGMTINIQGSVIGTEEFTEEVLMPQIEEGLRLGNTI